MFTSESNQSSTLEYNVLDHVNVTVMMGVMLGVIAAVELGMILLSWLIYKVSCRSRWIIAR